jgi:hypothetical protein
MKYFKEDQKIDGVAEPEDILHLRIQVDIAGGQKLYVDLNGITILRIGRIKQPIKIGGE